MIIGILLLYIAVLLLYANWMIVTLFPSEEKLDYCNFSKILPMLKSTSTLSTTLFKVIFEFDRAYHDKFKVVLPPSLPFFRKKEIETYCYDPTVYRPLYFHTLKFVFIFYLLSLLPVFLYRKVYFRNIRIGWVWTPTARLLTIKGRQFHGKGY